MMDLILKGRFNKTMDFFQIRSRPDKTFTTAQDPLLQSLVNRLELKIIRHGFLNGDKTWDDSLPASAFHRIYLMRHGSAWITCRGKRLPLKPGNAYFLPAGLEYFPGAEKRFEKFFVHFTFEPFPGMNPFGESEAPRLIGKKPCASLLGAVSGLSQGTPASWTIFKGELLKIMSCLITSNRKDFEKIASSQGKYAWLTDMIENTPYSSIRLRNLSKFHGLKVRQFGYHFQRDMGMSVKTFLNRRFLERAKAELAAGDKKVRQVAQALGFEDELYFSRFFRKQAGESPKRFMERHRL